MSRSETDTDSDTTTALAAAVLERGGRTLAADAGIELENEPGPLYQLLVLALLMSAPISARIAVATAGELRDAGYTTPQRMYEATWQQRVDVLGRGGYRRYDESTSTTLGQGAELLLERYSGDLRGLAEQAGGDVDRLTSRLKEVKGIGNVGAGIFLREVQGVWPGVRPYFDKLTFKGAARVSLPQDTDALAALVPGEELHRLAAGLVRVARDKKLTEAVESDAGLRSAG